jgi:hypothetical protein
MLVFHGKKTAPRMVTRMLEGAGGRTARTGWQGADCRSRAGID